MPIQHIRVVDLSQLLAGPYACMLLGAMGADVIKVEPLDGEEGRVPGPPFIGTDSTLFFCSNWHKRSLACDLKTPLGRRILARLLDRADVLVHNFRPNAAKRLGLDEETIEMFHPNLIHCAIAGFASASPFAETPGVDSVLQARAGIASVNGEPDGIPLKCGVPIVDMSTGIYAAVGILGALVEREKTGRGRRVDMTMADSALALQSMLFSVHFANGMNTANEPPADPARVANDSHIAVSNTFETKDGRMALSLISERFWTSLTTALGSPVWANDPKFATVVERMNNKNALYAVLGETFRTKTTAEWKALLDAASIPCASVQSYSEVLADDALKNAHVWVEAAHPKAGNVRGVNAPVTLGRASSTAKAPPVLGADTVAILQEHGYKPSEIESFVADKVVRVAEL